MKTHTCDRCLCTIERADQSVQFCSFCQPADQLLYTADDVHQFRGRMYEKLRAEGTTEFVARFHTLLIGHTPYWQARRY